MPRRAIRDEAIFPAPSDLDHARRKYIFFCGLLAAAKFISSYLSGGALFLLGAEGY